MIDFEHVSKEYKKGGRLALEDINLHVDDGEFVFLLGHSGAGKSTLLKLLMRFWDTDLGQVEISGENIKGINTASLRAAESFVEQDTVLFHDSIEENVKIANRNATHEQVVAACRKASIHDFIMTLPQGYDTRVANDAESISQGQRQLLTIARVLLNNPAILILDEATSSVDTRTELAIGRAMDALMRGRTSFVIAHRLSTIVDADLILVMDHGNIIEQGTHKELLAAEGAYADLYLSQFA